MRLAHKTPCQGCPFRRDSVGGWLGEDTGDPAEYFLATVDREQAQPCHNTIDYDDPDWEDGLDSAPYCAGQLVFFRNNCKLPKNRELPVNLVEPDYEKVFSRRDEFITHHTLEHGDRDE